MELVVARFLGVALTISRWSGLNADISMSAMMLVQCAQIVRLDRNIVEVKCIGVGACRFEPGQSSTAAAGLAFSAITRHGVGRAIASPARQRQSGIWVGDDFGTIRKHVAAGDNLEAPGVVIEA